MAMEKIFGIFKGKWYILLKRIDLSFQNLLDIVAVSLCLYNLCILKSNEFDMDLIKSAKKKIIKRSKYDIR